MKDYAVDMVKTGSRIPPPASTYFNNAATSYPKPPEVAAAVVKCVDSLPQDSRRGNPDEGIDIMETCRTSVATLFGVPDPHSIIFTGSATEAMNLLVFGSGLEGGHVVTTAAEHNSVLRPLKELEARGGIGLSIAACDGCGRVDPDAIRDAIRPSTRAVFVTHASNVTGAITDIPSVSRVAKERGLRLFVDASQSAGATRVTPDSWNADGVVFAGHKSLLGIAGVGGVALRKGLDLRPLKVGGTGTRSESLSQPMEWPGRYEAGTANRPGLAGLNAGVRHVLQHGLAGESLPRRESPRDPGCEDFWRTGLGGPSPHLDAETGRHGSRRMCLHAAKRLRDDYACGTALCAPHPSRPGIHAGRVCEDQSVALYHLGRGTSPVGCSPGHRRQPKEGGLKITAVTNVEDCFDGTSVCEVEFDLPVTREFITRLGGLGEIEYFPDFPRPFYRLEVKSSFSLRGVERATSARMIVVGDKDLAISRLSSFLSEQQKG